MLDGLARRAARAFYALLAPTPAPGRVSLMLDVPEFEAARLVQSLRQRHADEAELEQLRDEVVQLDDITKRQAARIEVLEHELAAKIVVCTQLEMAAAAPAPQQGAFRYPPPGVGGRLATPAEAARR